MSRSEFDLCFDELLLGARLSVFLLMLSGDTRPEVDLLRSPGGTRPLDIVAFVSAGERTALEFLTEL